jgi:hypothetical protein
MSPLFRLRRPSATELFSMALLIAAAACGDRACLEKASTRAVSGSFCPSRGEASQLFANQCGSFSDQSVASVDSDPTEEGKLCCYDVTTRTNGAPCIASQGGSPK